jgi:hypothetical protein
VEYASQTLKIAMLAPPWIEMPPPGYGGIEQVLALLVAELTERGDEVTLFAAPGTRSRAQVPSPLERTHPEAPPSSSWTASTHPWSLRPSRHPRRSTWWP